MALLKLAEVLGRLGVNGAKPADLPAQLLDSRAHNFHIDVRATLDPGGLPLLLG